MEVPISSVCQFSFSPSFVPTIQRERVVARAVFFYRVQRLIVSCLSHGCVQSEFDVTSTSTNFFQSTAKPVRVCWFDPSCSHDWQQKRKLPTDDRKNSWTQNIIEIIIDARITHNRVRGENRKVRIVKREIWLQSLIGFDKNCNLYVLCVDQKYVDT